MTARRWTWTLWNTEKNVQDVGACGNIRYMVWQKELSPTTKKEHLQGYVVLNSSMRMAGVKKLFSDDTIHLEMSKGTDEENTAYCTKLETRIEGPWTWGSIEKKPGKRTDIKNCYDMIKEGKNDYQIQEEYTDTYCKYYKAFDRMRANILQWKYADVEEPWKNIPVHVRWGETRAGKSRFVKKMKDVYVLVIGKDLWFDGYVGQKILLIEEYEGQIDISNFLQIIDGYPSVRLPYKGGHTYSDWDEIYITSNIHPKNWYKNLNIRREEALFARFTSVTEVGVILDPTLETEPIII